MKTTLTFDSAPGIAEGDLIAAAGQKRPYRVVRVCEANLEVKRLSRLRWWWMRFTQWVRKKNTDYRFQAYDQ